MEFPHGIMMHHFWDERHPKGQGAISGPEFSRMIEWLGPDRILSAEDWLDRVRNNTLQSHHLCLTFDDALRCQYDVAVPVLKNFGLTAFWFVYSSVFEGGVEPLEVFRYFRTSAFDNVEKFYDAFDSTVLNSPYAALVVAADKSVDYTGHLSEFDIYSFADRRFRYLRDRVLGPQAYNASMWQMIERTGWKERIPLSLLWMDDQCLVKLAAEGHVVGLHSFSHPTALASLSVETQRTEYIRNAKHLTRCLGAAPKVMSHPCNSYSHETLRILRDLNIEVGFRSNMTQPALGPLEMPRRDHSNVMAEMISQ